MKTEIDAASGRLAVEAETPGEAAAIQALAAGKRRRSVFGIASLRARPARLELQAEPRDRPPSVARQALLRLADRIGERGADWLAAAGLLGLSWWALGHATAAAPPALRLGLALVAFAAAAGLSLWASLTGVAPAAGTPRIWRWAYWYAGVLAIIGAAALAVGAILWLGTVLGGIAMRTVP